MTRTSIAHFVLLVGLGLGACHPPTQPTAPAEHASQGAPGAGIQPAPATVPAPKPLPSWNDGPAKQSILDFVAAASRPGDPRFAPADARVAVFDNDGTLWAEQPVYFQVMFAFDRVKALAPSHPEWGKVPTLKAAAASGLASAATIGLEGILDVMDASQIGQTQIAYGEAVRSWLAESTHPTLKRRFTTLVYAPMLELLALLRQHGFAVYIVSGGGLDFMRAWAPDAYGIPPENIIGSVQKAHYEVRPDGPFIVSDKGGLILNDGPEKPVSIQRFIGRRPIFAFGNSDGDYQMLEWTASQPNGFAGLVHHTDAAREFAYDRGSKIGKLDKALTAATERHWTVVDMQRDWARVFPEP